MPTILLVLAAAVLTVLRLFVPTDPDLTWVEAFKAGAHIYVGVMLCLLVQKRGRWELGWFCLLLPSLLELGLFILARVLASIPAV